MALANDIALYALGYWSHEHHPIRINALCLNTKQRKTPCSACTEACPENIVLHSGKANWSACSNCNLCVTACPTAAINQSSTSFAGIRQLILEGGTPISFACERAEEAADVHCVCLASIPWDLFAAAALSNGVIIKADACKTCPHASFVKQVKRTIRKLRQFLSEETFAASVFLHDQPNKQRSAGADKRLAFTHFADSVSQSAEVALEGQRTPSMSCYRALLLEVLQQRNDKALPAEVSWRILTEDSHCRACEICTKMCPHNALSLHIPGYTDKAEVSDKDSQSENPPNAEAGNSAQFLLQDASKCTQCGLCYVSCPEENLGGWDLMKSTRIPAVKAWTIEVALCEKCGHPFKPEDGATRCGPCSRKSFSWQTNS